MDFQLLICLICFVINVDDITEKSSPWMVKIFRICLSNSIFHQIAITSIYFIIIRVKNQKIQNFDIIQGYQFDDIEVPYDYDSVMHYQRNALLINRKSTIVAKNNESMQLRQYIGLSQGDIRKINKMYSCDPIVRQAQNHSTTIEDDRLGSDSHVHSLWMQYLISKYYFEENSWKERHYFSSDFKENNP